MCYFKMYDESVIHIELLITLFTIEAQVPAVAPQIDDCQGSTGLFWKEDQVFCKQNCSQLANVYLILDLTIKNPHSQIYLTKWWNCPPILWERVKNRHNSSPWIQTLKYSHNGNCMKEKGISLSTVLIYPLYMPLNPYEY